MWPPSALTPALSIVRFSVVTSPSFLAWQCVQPELASPGDAAVLELAGAPCCPLAATPAAAFATLVTEAWPWP